MVSNLQSEGFAALEQAQKILRVLQEWTFPGEFLNAIADGKAAIQTDLMRPKENDPLQFQVHFEKENLNGASARQIAAMKDRGYKPAEIAKKVDLDVTYVNGILRLLKNGEERLLVAVEKRQLPLSVAIAICGSSDQDVQRAMTEAYETARIEAAAQMLRDLAGADGHAGLVTRGAEGVVVAAPDGMLYEGRLYVRGRFPVGSGDAFLAGLVTGLDGGDDWPDALRLALGAAAANAELPGAGRLDPARARALAAAADVQPA